MKRRVVLIAADRSDASDWVQSQPWLPWRDVVVVTPRSPDAARGQVADYVLATDEARLGIAPARFAELEAACLPCVLVSGR